MTEIEDFIKKNFEPVEDKPGFVWFSRRNLQIISIETLAKCLEDAKRLSHRKVKVREYEKETC